MEIERFSQSISNCFIPKNSYGTSKFEMRTMLWNGATSHLCNFLTKSFIIKRTVIFEQKWIIFQALRTILRNLMTMSPTTMTPDCLKIFRPHQSIQTMRFCVKFATHATPIVCSCRVCMHAAVWSAMKLGKRKMFGSWTTTTFLLKTKWKHFWPRNRWRHQHAQFAEK